MFTDMSHDDGSGLTWDGDGEVDEVDVLRVASPTAP